MNRIKIAALLIALLFVTQHSFTQEESSSTTLSQYLANRDPRYVVLTGLGVAAGALGLWIIKQSVDKMLADNADDSDIAMGDKILRLSSKSLATLIGLFCTIGGGAPIITGDYKIESTFNT